MPSSYSSNLKIELMATGENSGTWGTNTNTNLGTAMEQAIIGYGNPDYTSDANLTITISNSSAAQAARALVLNVTSVFGSLTATRELIVPTIQKQYIVQNNTTGGQSITVKTSAGTGITVPTGRKAHLYVDGTNVIQMFDFVDINGGTIDGATVGASSASTGSFTTLNATGAITLNTTTNNQSYTTTGAGIITISSGTAGSINNMTIGATTAGTGRFSSITNTGLTSGRVVFSTTAGLETDSANLTFSGTILTSAGFAGPLNGTVGATTPATGAFTTLSATGNVTLGDASADTLNVGNGDLIKDASGNLGLGVTPSAWVTYSGIIDLKGNGSVAAFNQSVLMAANAYYNGTNFIYKATTSAGYYQIAGNQFQWFNAASGTAGNAITFTQAMTLDASGNLGVGTTSPVYRLDVSGYMRGVVSNASVGNASSAQFVQNSTGDAAISFLIGATTEWLAGVDNSDSDSFKINAITGGGDFNGAGITLTTGGNLGLGVTPSAWSSYKALQVKGASLASNTSELELSANSYFSSGWKYYLSSVGASNYEQFNGVHAWFNAPSGTAGNAITFTQAMTLDASGNLGIGTTSPASKLNVADTSTNCTVTVTNSASNFQVQSNSNDGYFNLNGSGNIIFRSGTPSVTERARIDSSGNLCVGKTGDVLANTGCFLDNRGSSTFTRDAAPATYINRLTSDGDALIFLRSTTQVGSVSVTTLLTTYNTTSDYRLKNNQAPLTNSGVFIDALQPKTWDWAQDGSRGAGFIAHEFAEVSPSSVSGTKDSVDAEGKPMYQSMQASSAEVIANLVAELQSLRARVAQLESKP